MCELNEAEGDAIPVLLSFATEKAAPMTLTDTVLELFERLRDPIYGFLLRLTHDPYEAEDLTQETFLRLFRHLRDERPLDNPRAWLFTVAHNLAMDKIRDESHFADLDDAMWRELEKSRSGVHADPEKSMMRNERTDRLHAAVLRLTGLQRRCLHLRADGLRLREIAQLLGLSTSTVVDALRRATVRLAKEFQTEVLE
jgi:RNA polymerase sigma-70 factor (ECF subfamily)